ncbi:MAG TPA: pyrimidine 5'-nucleotidase, partial [Anaerolineales bacterium]|nr:pyrimidine 5'-nucleotidase [Anaerolineales bacterium]
MKFQTILFDLDATLYPAENGFWAEIGARIGLYLRERMGIAPDQTATLQKQYYLEYGTTLRGLQHHHHIDPQDYLQFVHDIPVQTYLQPDPPLRELIRTLPLRKWIFTNSDHAHATRVLSALGLTDCFDGIISLESLDYECKPHPIVYQTALQITGTPNPHQVLYLD